jgi:hypothetical protein
MSLFHANTTPFGFFFNAFATTPAAKSDGSVHGLHSSAEAE